MQEAHTFPKKRNPKLDEFKSPDWPAYYLPSTFCPVLFQGPEANKAEDSIAGEATSLIAVGKLGNGPCHYRKARQCRKRQPYFAM